MLPLTVLWTLIALVCAVLEIVLPAFSFIFLSLAALGSAAAAALDLGLGYQLATFGLTLIGSVLLLRPLLKAKFGLSRQTVLSRTDVLIGKHAVVTTALGGDASFGGRVLVEGQDWAAEADSKVAVGATVLITGADGIVLTVRATEKGLTT